LNNEYGQDRETGPVRGYVLVGERRVIGRDKMVNMMDILYILT
jgi:hypothetical protein